jgi:hypothetical protein
MTRVVLSTVPVSMSCGQERRHAASTADYGTVARPTWNSLTTLATPLTTFKSITTSNIMFKKAKDRI